MKKTILILTICCLSLLFISTTTAGFFDEPKNIKNVTTTYGTNCSLDIGKGMIPEETGVNGSTQVLAFSDGRSNCYFISTSKDIASDLIKTVQSGTKCRDGDIVWYHLSDKELVNGWGAFGSHVKVKTTNEMDVGFLESSVSDEVIVLVAPPDTIVDCFKSVKWGNGK